MKDQWPEYWAKVCAAAREHYGNLAEKIGADPNSRVSDAEEMLFAARASRAVLANAGKGPQADLIVAQAEQELHAAKASVWTRELPTEPGLYWLAWHGSWPSSDPLRVEPVWIRKRQQGDYIKGPLALYGMMSEVESDFLGEDAYRFQDCRWLGPLPVPPKPEE